MAKSFTATPPAYLSTADPQPLVIDGPNVWNGFITNLSDLLTFDVGLQPILEPEVALVAYPNPTDEKLSLQLGTDWSGSADVSIYDATGRLVRSLAQWRPLRGELRIDLGGIAPGPYSGLVSGVRTGRFTFIKQ